MRASRALSILAAVLLGLVAATVSPASGQLGSAVDGTLDVSAVQADVDGVRQETLRQQYNAYFQKGVTDYIDLRLGIRYFKFDVEADSTAQVAPFREEWQPSAELQWTHPYFRLSASGFRRSARSPLTNGEFLTQNASLDWISLVESWPTLNLRYDWQTVEDTGDSTGRDTEQRRALAEAHWQRDDESFTYAFTRTWNENFERSLDSVENNHLFRYLGQHRAGQDGQVQFTSQYVFHRSARKDDVPTGVVLLEEIPVREGLFAVDPAPETGALGAVPGLTDGITTVATSPTIDIGAGTVDRNIGVDVGFRRQIGAVHLYTNVLSGSTLGFAVYVSDDNLDWRLHATQARVVYRTTVQRFELEFPSVETRYLKVVVSGSNPISSVLVTEIVALEPIDEKGEVQRVRSAHLFDGRMAWRAAEDLDLSLDGAIRLEPAQGSVEDRQNLDYAFRARWSPQPLTSHNLRWEQSWQLFERDRGDLRDDVLSYAFLYDPLPTLSTSTSVSTRLAHERGQRMQEVHSWVVEANGSPWSTLRLSLENSLSRIHQLVVAPSTSDAWNVRAVVDANVTRSLDVFVNWGHQQIWMDPDSSLRVRQTYGVNADLRLTQALFFRAGLNWIEDERFNRNQNYLMSWTLGPRLVITGQLDFDDASEGFSSRRASATATYDLGSRATLYVRYSDIDLSMAGGVRTESWQEGIRWSF